MGKREIEYCDGCKEEFGSLIGNKRFPLSMKSLDWEPDPAGGATTYPNIELVFCRICAVHIKETLDNIFKEMEKKRNRK